VQQEQNSQLPEPCPQVEHEQSSGIFTVSDFDLSCAFDLFWQIMLWYPLRENQEQVYILILTPKVNHAHKNSYEE
jgi:hypothetical protein